MDIQPIETHYNGYRFRSRLEARWAVFFDTLGIRYEYELEGYDLLGSHRYLPDFWLSQVNMFAEVKPFDSVAIHEFIDDYAEAHDTYPSTQEFINGFVIDSKAKSDCQKMALLAKGSGHNIILLCGIPDYTDYPVFGSEGWLSEVALVTHYIYQRDERRFYWCSGFSGWAEDYDCMCHKPELYSIAVRKARSTRFEHGEKP